VSYRSAIQYHTDGSVELRSDGTPAGQCNRRQCADHARRTERREGRPQGAGYPHRQCHPDGSATSWEMLGDVSWTGWSSIKNIDIIRTSDCCKRAPPRSPSWRISRTPTASPWAPTMPLFGRAQVHVWPGLRSDPGQEGASRLTSLPDNDRTWFTLGTQWKPAREQTLELGLPRICTSRPPRSTTTRPPRSAHESRHGHWRLRFQRLDTRRAVLDCLLIALPS
jgi:hypothetical protein